MNHAKRVVNIENPSKEELSIIIPDDFKELQSNKKGDIEDVAILLDDHI